MLTLPWIVENFGIKSTIDDITAVFDLSENSNNSFMHN